MRVFDDLASSTKKYKVAEQFSFIVKHFSIGRQGEETWASAPPPPPTQGKRTHKGEKGEIFL